MTPDRRSRATQGSAPSVAPAAAAFVLLSASGLAACAGGSLRGRVDEVGVVIREARASGAQNCAPVELAMAVAHAEFAAIEMDDGDYSRARDELLVAERNADQARRRSPRERCVVAGPADLDRDGIPDDRDECRRQPEDRDGADDEDGCPESDNDSDGFVDQVDKCPDAAEDRDGYQDEDGCPDRDNDGDRLVDRVDQCPDQAEDADGHDDDDGCPDCDDDGDGALECPERVDKCPGRAGRPTDGCPYRNLRITDKRIELRQPIRFKRRRARLAPFSLPLLDEVAQALADQPSLRVRVEAHTDSKGRDRSNLRLSRARAAAVRSYLISRGIDGSRMVSEGYGERRPIADNRTAAGRAQNQRIEFVLTAR